MWPSANTALSGCGGGRVEVLRGVRPAVAGQGIAQGRPSPPVRLGVHASQPDGNLASAGNCRGTASVNSTTSAGATAASRPPSAVSVNRGS